jgi:Na+-transporting methylmalonyl-CoA/oxaloacetate decarboxylase gamma subunit
MMIGTMVTFNILLLLISADELAARESEALLLALVGMSVVFLALVTIGTFIFLLGRLFAERPAPVAETALSSSAEGIDARTVAILSAAAVAAVGRPVRIQRITFINRNTISAWAERGRVSIHGSHNVRRTL